jgi:hypothetical protein
MNHLSVIAIAIFGLAVMAFPSLLCAQTFKMQDGSSVTIDNPQHIPLTQQDINQIVQTLKKSYLSANEKLDGSISSQNYRRQIETELNVERSKRDTIREYDSLARDRTKTEREQIKTERLKQGKDSMLYIEKKKR